jgi:hypothetical protein
VRPRTTLLLALAVLVLVAVIALWERELPGTTERSRRAQLVLPTLDPAAVDRIQLERPDGRLVLERRPGEPGRFDDEWWLGEPLADRADRADVEALLADLADLRIERQMRPDELDVEDPLGETPLRLRVTGEGLDETIVIGASPLPGGHRFARRGDADELMLVGAELAGRAARPVDAWRDPALFQQATVDVESAFFGRADAPDLVFGRRDGTSWWIEQPITDDADDAAVSALLSTVLALRAQRFLPPEAARALEPPGLVVELAPREEDDGPPARLEVAAGPLGESGARAARVAGRDAVVAVHPAAILRELDAELDRWRSPLATDFSTYEVGEVVIERGGERVVLRRTGEERLAGGWAAAEPADFPLDEAAVRDLLAATARIEAETVATGPDAPAFDEPVARLTVRGRDPGLLDTVVLEIGPAVGEGRVAARRIGRDVVLVIDEGVAARIDPAAVRADEELR